MVKNVGFNSGDGDRDFCFPVAFFPHHVASAAGIANLRQKAALHLFASLRLRVRLDVLDGAAENRRSSDVKANALGDDGVPRSVEDASKALHPPQYLRPLVRTACSALLGTSSPKVRTSKYEY